jgi:hypothetical protein
MGLMTDTSPGDQLIVAKHIVGAQKVHVKG